MSTAKSQQHETRGSYLPKKHDARFVDTSAEGGIIGAILYQGFEKVEGLGISPFDFDEPNRQRVFLAAEDMHASGQGCTWVSLAKRLGMSSEDLRLLGSEEGTFATQPLLADWAGQLRECHANRKAHEILKQWEAGTLSIEGAQDGIAEIIGGAAALNPGAILDSRRFDAAAPPPPARPIYKLGGATIGTPGNLVVVAAQAKAGKSALVGAFIASVMDSTRDTLGIVSANKDGHAVAHFDTEQSPADHHSLVMTALRRVEIETDPDWLRSYRILDVPTAQRFALLEHALRTARGKHGGIHSVLLDGVADFVMDPNDAAEAFATVERLHRLAVEYDTCIVCVLHFNPGSEMNKTRGHLGSQLERKAETNLALEKDEEGVTVVYSKLARHAHVPKSDGPRFQWDSEAGMHVSCETVREVRHTANAAKLRAIADEVFADQIRYTDALSAIQRVAKVGKRQSETIFGQLSKGGLIQKNVIGNWEVLA